MNNKNSTSVPPHTTPKLLTYVIWSWKLQLCKLQAVQDGKQVYSGGCRKLMSHWVIRTACKLIASCMYIAMQKSMHTSIYNAKIFTGTVGPWLSKPWTLDYPNSTTDCSIRVFWLQVYVLLE